MYQEKGKTRLWKRCNFLLYTRKVKIRKLQFFSHFINHGLCLEFLGV